MFKLERSRTEKVSPKRAQEILAHENTFEGQRSLRQPHAVALSVAIKSGTMAKGNIAFGQNGESRVVVNGQHTLQGIVFSDTSLTCTIDEYQCDTNEDFWMLYASFDVGKNRSDADVMRAARCRFESGSLQIVPLRTLSACATALSFLRDGIEPDFTMKTLAKAEKPTIVQQYESDILFVGSLYEGLNSDPTVPLATPIIATGRANKKRATDFWTRVLGGFDLVKGSPEWNLHRSLFADQTTAIKVGLKGNGRIRITSTWNLCVGWWNSFITGDARRSVKLAGIKTPMKIVQK